MQHPAHFDDGRPSFDQVFARELIGKYVLVGITVQDKRGKFKRREQFHGRVVSANEQSGIVLSLLGMRAGEFKTLPPMTEVFESAPSGTYSLKDTGEEVVDPDFMCTWMLTQPDA
jgi:hypothetical protein